jgi:hypothetical protein
MLTMKYHNKLQCNQIKGNSLASAMIDRGHPGRDHMVVGIITTYAISAYQHECCEFEQRSGEVYSIQQYVIKFVLLAVGLWFRPGTLASSINKTDSHDVTEILLKVASNTITLILTSAMIPYNR